jgi:GTPase SAR1 family protein
MYYQIALRKTIEIDGTNITFDIFDTSGAEEYKAIQDQYVSIIQRTLVVIF